MRTAVVLALSAALGAQTAERHLSYGFEQRVRNENWNNVLDFNDSAGDHRRQIRYRTRLWFGASITPDIDLRIGLAQETNQVLQPRTPGGFDEVFFETAYVDIRKLFIKGLSLRFGRQNLTRGEGFLLLEGNPYDGSRSVYNNAAVLAYERGKSRIELLGIHDPVSDRYLPRIHDLHRPLVEWNESALGAYFTSHRFTQTSVEAYYLYKRETGDRRSPAHPQFQPDRYVYTSGGRAVRKLPGNFSATGEWAWQWGHQRPSAELRAWGGYGYLKKNFGPQSRHSASFGYWAMSGDDPATPGRIESWDPLFARWPKWSELYIYTQFRETGVAYWTNMGMWQAEAVFAPWTPLSLRGAWYHMGAQHPFPGSSSMFSRGRARGEHYQARADLSVGKHWRGHFLYERHVPGSFYTGDRPGYFLRIEVAYTYSRSHVL